MVERIFKNTIRVRCGSGNFSALELLTTAVMAWLAILFFAAVVHAQTIDAAENSSSIRVTPPATAILAGGCFWCVETDLEKLPGVFDVISGYSGGRTKNPTYENYSLGGHREVVHVTYNPTKLTFAGLVEYFIKHIDPTDRTGSFRDKGRQYSPAVYYADDQEKDAANQVFKAIEAMKVYRKPISVTLLPRAEFWPAEEYHQNYHAKNGVKYNAYRTLSGRDAFVFRHWGSRANVLSLPLSKPVENAAAKTSDPTAVDKGAKESSAVDRPGAPEKSLATAEESPPIKPWESFKKPPAGTLRSKLSDTQFRVTQMDATEPAFRNKYWNYHQDGIYVDVVSGEPLFSSKDKFDSGTGWPSFVKPIDPQSLLTRIDRKQVPFRTEVRSKLADSHLGHVFSDGPPSRGGMRYCMNSAALKFIPTNKLAEEGYEEFLALFEE